MKISIIGSNGFLSSAITKYAIQEGWEVDIYGLYEPIDKNYNRYFPINLMESEIDYANITESNIIVYASGAGIQSNLNEYHHLIYSLNVNVPVQICNRLKDFRYSGCFVSFGSVFEMGETKGKTLFTEADIITSLSPAPNDYTTSKRMFSRFVSSYNHDFTHWHFIIPTIYGKGENPQRLIPYVVDAIHNKKALNFTSGDQIRQYVHVSEIARLIDLAFTKKLPSGVYNVPGKDILSVREIVELIHDVFHQETPKNCFGTIHRTDIGMKYLALDGEKLKKEIGFTPSISIREVIMDYVKK